MHKNPALTGVILAAGKGVRMQSSLPKVLHKIAGKAMLEHVVSTLQATPLGRLCVVLNENLEPFTEFMAAHGDINICIQKVQNGTGGAVASCAPSLLAVEACGFAPATLHAGSPYPTSHLLICAGDCPALQAEVLNAFIADSLAHGARLAVLGIEVEQPQGYGRLILGDKPHSLRRIVEEKDASQAERELRLCNSGVLFAETAYLFELLRGLKPANAQGEYYLTDCIEDSFAAGHPARVYLTQDWQSFLGVNTPEQLASLSLYMQNH